MVYLLSTYFCCSLEMDRRLEIVSISPLATKAWTLKIKSSMEPVYRTMLTLTAVNASDASWQEDYLLALVLKFVAKPQPLPPASDGKAAKDDLHIAWTSTLVYPDKLEVCVGRINFTSVAT